MSKKTGYGKISKAPTRPGRRRKKSGPFDVADLYGSGPLALPGDGTGDEEEAPGLDEKLRQAYFWLVNHAILSPFYDIEFNDAPPTLVRLGDNKVPLHLPSDQSYSSYVLMPLLNLAVRRRCLLVGGPGRGKTVIAVLMGLLGGYPLRDVKRSIQHGQPQMTIADLLGNPLPSSLVNAKSMDDVVISWRKWLSMRVKIIDEYNRIPTRTQSALLTVMADNYAEMYDQIYECPEAAWYLTANDDAGGGTYQVIEALRDRIDIVVKALHFNTRFLGDLLLRIESGVSPEDVVPSEIIFTEEELDRAEREILGVEFPRPLLRRFEFFAGHFEFFESAADQIEYMTKDTVKLAGLDLKALIREESGKDKSSYPGAQTLNGLSVRALMTSMVFIKAMAYFRGADTVTYEDIRQVLPFVLHDKLVQNQDCPFFEKKEHRALRSDRVSWIRLLFDRTCKEYDRLGLDDGDPVKAAEEEFGDGLDGLSAKETRKRIASLEREIKKIARAGKFYGHMFDDLLKLKYFHQRYSNYLRWLEWH